MSHAKLVERKLNARELKAFLMNLGSAEAKEDTLFETIINTVAHNALMERGQRENGIMDISLNRAVAVLDENDPEFENQSKRLDNIRASTIIFTPHPNWDLSDEARAKLSELYETFASLSDEEWHKIAGNRKDKNITDKFKLDEFFNSLTKPTKLTVAQEWERTHDDAQILLESIPHIAAKLQFTKDTTSDNPQHKTRISPENLEKYVGLIKSKTWGLDRDSKPNVTAAAMEQEIQKQIDRTRAEHVKRLEKMREQLSDAGFGYEANQISNFLSDFKKENKPVSWLADQLLAMKKDRTEKSGFPKFIDAEGNATAFSILDVAYLQIKTAGECWPKGEIRQNAAMHATAIRYARGLLPKDAGQNANVNDILSELKVNTSKVQKPINAEIDRLKPLVEQYYADKSEQKMSELGLMQNAIDFYETFAGLRVANQYPHAIHSYVIAETGVMKKEDFERSVAGKISQLRADHSRAEYYHANPKMSDADVEVTARNEVISERVKEDLLSVMLMKAATACDDYKEKMQADKLEIIPLFESFESITKGWGSLDRLEHNAHFQEYIKTCNRNPLPTITDPTTGEIRTMTIADAKQILGIEHKITEEDKITPVKAAITVMHAGSDAMRENGLGIGPLNTHYQERVQEKLIEQGIWVNIYQGTGAAVHRSHPPAPHVARATLQGGERDHMTVSAMVIRMLKSIAVSVAAAAGYTLPEEFHNVLASYPGHMGNSMMMPKETREIKEATQAPLEAACAAHESRFDDPVFEHFFQKSTAFDYTKMFNFSARPDGRVGGFELSKVRAIGFSMSLFATGSNNTLIGGMNEFFGMNHDNGYQMDDTRRDDIMKWLQKSPKIQEMMTRLTHGIATANMDSAWEFQGVTRIVDENGNVMLKKDSTTVPLNDLLDAKGEVTKENASTYKYADVFGSEAIALAQADKEYQTTAKAVYEIYSRMQIDLMHKKLLEKTIPMAGTYHADKSREAQLKVLEKELAAPYFDPKKIFEIMTPEMAAELEEKMKPVDRARMALANHHNGTVKMDEQKLYRSFATCMEAFETGADACLRYSSRNFTNDVVLDRVTGEKGGGEYSMATSGLAR